MNHAPVMMMGGIDSSAPMWCAHLAITTPGTQFRISARGMTASRATARSHCCDRGKMPRHHARDERNHC